LPNLWKTCWEEPAQLMAPGLPGSGCFLIKPFFSITWEPVYRFWQRVCARSFLRYPRFVLTHLCASCGKHRPCHACRGFHGLAQDLTSKRRKQLIHSDFSQWRGLRKTFHNGCGANLEEAVDKLYPDRWRPRTARCSCLSTFFDQMARVASLLACSGFPDEFSTSAVQRSARNLWAGCGWIAASPAPSGSR